jgi:drug/metabolite transporter (DMT)-like permease
MGASGAAAPAGASSVMLAILYGLAYLTAASSIILLNKHVLSVTPFHFPIALSSLGVLFGWVTSVVGVHTGIISLEKHKDITFGSWVQTVLPIGFFTGVTLACGNMAYFYLSLSFLQMTKALAPVALFFILWVTGLDRFHLNVFLAVIVIVIGTAVAAFAEVHFTWIGIGLIVVAETFEAIKSACFQFLLANKSFTMWEGMYFVSPASLIFLSILIYSMELQDMIKEDAWGQIKEHPLMFFAAGTLGFGVNYCSLGVIKHAGSLTLKVLAQMKSIIIILFGIAIYHDIVSTQTACGYATAIVGFGFYNYAKIKAKEEDDAVLAAEIAAAEGKEGETAPLVDGEKKV